MIIGFNNKLPEISEKSCILPGVFIIGDVRIKDNVIIMFNSIIRGDEDKIFIDTKTNIQDNCTIHTDIGYPVYIGENVTIGHNCIIHGAEIKNNVIIGMGTTVLNGAIIPDNVIVGANSLVTQNKILKENSLYMGSPAKKIRELTDNEVEEIFHAAEIYQELLRKYKSYFKYKA